MPEKVAFIGLGVMGFHMAGHLARAGHRVRVYNRTADKAERWCSLFSGTRCLTPAAAASGSTFVFSCVGNDADIREVATGPGGAFAAMDDGSVFVDHTTTSAVLARDLARIAGRRGIAFLDAPVSGGESGAQKGTLTVMAGGDSVAFSRAKPVIESYAKAVTLLGTSGTGQLTKMVNQICIAGIVEGLAEALHFAEEAGLDARKVIEVISRGAAQSWQMENRHSTMLKGEFDFGFAVDWMRKDLGFCLDEARRNGAHLPVTALVDQLYGEVQSMGGGRWDTSSLIARLRRGRKPEASS